ncbi:hypothetical protein DPMN_045972 [Dreissena polymorpha]|uniref:Uncharacterized protein n=1 Tax=Dreissena polymorpha TaxID=45954 RepID=A0A9D4D5W8_DREPO|nr:hypothetical protein DPMN_045972 [Dreissena polymorpha]
MESTSIAAQLAMVFAKACKVFFFMFITFQKKIFHLLGNWPFLHITPSMRGMCGKQLAVKVNTFSAVKLVARFAIEIS